MFRNLNIEEIVEIVSQTSSHTGIYVGCDSSQRKDYCVFATVVVIHHDRSRGANVFVKVDRTPRISSLRQRIMMEVHKAVEVAIMICSLIPDRVIEVHLDINTSSSHISSSLVKEASGYVSAQGFKPVFKPQSFAAYCVADYVCKKH